MQIEEDAGADELPETDGAVAVTADIAGTGDLVTGEITVAATAAGDVDAIGIAVRFDQFDEDRVLIAVDLRTAQPNEMASSIVLILPKVYFQKKAVMLRSNFIECKQTKIIFCTAVSDIGDVILRHRLKLYLNMV